MKQEIEIEDLPEGYRAIAYRKIKKGDCYLSSGISAKLFGKLSIAQDDFDDCCLVVEKIQPRRIVLEETGEIRQPKEGEYVQNNGNYCMCRKPERWGNEHEIWKVVE